MLHSILSILCFRYYYSFLRKMKSSGSTRLVFSKEVGTLKMLLKARLNEKSGARQRFRCVPEHHHGLT